MVKNVILLMMIAAPACAVSMRLSQDFFQAVATPNVPPVRQNACAPFKEVLPERIYNALEEKVAHQEKPQPSSALPAFTYEHASRVIDSAALAYALIALHARYRAHQNQQQASSGTWSFFCPQWLSSAHAHGSFAFDAGVIMLKTVFYKSMAKLVVMCVTHDLTDLLGRAVARLQKLMWIP